MVFSIYIRLLLSSMSMYSVAVQTYTASEITSIVNLYENGTVQDHLETPYCKNKQKISLSSYTFRIKNCNNGDKRCQFPNKPLSPGAIMVLHDECSFKTECDSLDFSTDAKEQKNDSLHDVVIGFHCFDGEDRQFEMCGHQAETITGTVHLMTGKETRQYSSCQCTLKGQNNSLIAVTLKDIRLYSTDLSPRKCSESVLKIDENIFACNATSSAFGSIFNEALPMKAHMESIAVSLDAIDPDLDMVWLLIETQGSMSVECTGKRREIATSSIEVYGHLPTSNFQSDGISKNDRKVDEEITLELAIVILVAPVIMVCTVTAIICFRKRRGETDDLKSMSLRCRFICWIRHFFDHKSIRSRQLPQHQMPVESETVLVDKDDTEVDIHTHLASSSYDTEESPLSDETPMSDCYDKASNGGPVQESGQDGRDDPEEKNNAYAKLYPSLSKDGAIGNDQNNIYNNTQSKKQTPFRDPTYSHVPMERFPMTNSYNYARNKFLMSNI